VIPVSSLLAVLPLLIGAAPSEATLAWHTWADNGHEYSLWDGTGSWWDGYNATPPDAHMVSLSSSAEETWVWQTFGPLLSPSNGWLRFWIGLTDNESFGTGEGNWVWVTGEPVAYARWGPGEPNNWYEGEDFGESLEAGWNDLGNQTMGDGRYTIFERGDGHTNYGWQDGGGGSAVPEPASYVLLMLAAVGTGTVLGRARRYRGQGAPDK
jgi:hypothetical protein